MTDVTERQLPRALTPFRGRAYRRLAVALVFTTFAGGVWAVALVWEVVRIGGGASQLSVVATTSAVGVILPALLAGVVADRIPQKRILLTVAGLELACMSTVAALSLTGATQLWMLAVIGFLNGAGMAFYYPAYTAWLPALVQECDLMAVNGFEGMVRPTIGQAIGPAVAGAAVAAASPGFAVSIAAGSVLLGMLALVAVPETPLRRQLDERHAQHPIRSAATDMREGFDYMVRTPWLLATLPLAVIGYAGELWVVIASAFVLGACFAAPTVIWGTLLQRRVPAHLMGRVSSLDFFVSISLMPVSMALAGPVSEAIGLRPTFLIAGLVPSVLAVVTIVWARLPADELAHRLRG